jgi:plastocyanin
LKALGGGAALSLGTGAAAAGGDDDGANDGTDGNGANDGADDNGADDGAGGTTIDPIYGLAVPNVNAVPEKFDTEHTVELHVEGPVPGVHGPLFHFQPSGLHVDPGDVVQFDFVTPDHTVTAYHPGHGYQQRVPQGTPPFSSPLVNIGGAWLYRFDNPGVYDIFCAPHHLLGMAMRVVVGDIDDVPDYVDTFEGSEDPPLLAPFSKSMLEHELEVASPDGANDDSEWPWLTPREVLAADALDPANVQDGDGQVSFDDVFENVLRFDVAANGHYAWFPFGPDSWGRSPHPIEMTACDGRWLVQPTDDGGMRLLVENVGTEPPNRNAGFDLHVGSLADVAAVEIDARTVQTREGDTATLFVGLYLDVDGDGDFFVWYDRNDDVDNWVGIGHDEEGVTTAEAAGTVTVDDDTTVSLFEAGTEATLAELRDGTVEGVGEETGAAVYVGVIGGAGGAEEVVVEDVDVVRP